MPSFLQFKMFFERFAFPPVPVSPVGKIPLLLVIVALKINVIDPALTNHKIGGKIVDVETRRIFTLYL